jgi:hypothetical protein
MHVRRLYRFSESAPPDVRNRFVLVTANLAFWIAEWAMWTLSPHYSLKTAIAGTVLTYVSACMPALTVSRFLYLYRADREFTNNTQGSLSDGILAWRCYVTFGRPPWLKWALSFAIFANTGLFVRGDDGRAPS